MVESFCFFILKHLKVTLEKIIHNMPFQKQFRRDNPQNSLSTDFIVNTFLLYFSRKVIQLKTSHNIFFSKEMRQLVGEGKRNKTGGRKRMRKGGEVEKGWGDGERIKLGSPKAISKHVPNLIQRKLLSKALGSILLLKPKLSCNIR